MPTALFDSQTTFAQSTAGTTPGQPAVGLNRKVVLLSSAQILALFTTPVTLVPAPGVGFMIIPESLKIDMQAGSVAYADGGGGAVSFTEGSLTQALASNGIFTITALFRGHQTLQLAGTDTAAATPTDENAALTIAKATANFTAGNGTALVTVYYFIEPIAPTPN